MSVFSHASYDNHEQVTFCYDAPSGLKAVIAVHSTALGPAVGGCRMWDYATDEEALNDVLRLSRGMSYKNAMADLGLGGGKSVIIGNSKTDKSPEMMRAFGRFVNTLGGKYISAEDVGISVADIETAHEETPYVAGLNSGQHASGDPSPFTAHGVFMGLLASVKFQMKRDDLKGVRVAVQGLGSVGYNLATELKEAGAELIVADIVKANVKRAIDELGASTVDVSEIATQDVDVFAPCALGAIINDETIPNFKCKVIAGAANNQLKEARHGEALRKQGILYAPDYVINAGGIMNVANEVHGRKVTHEAGMKAVERIHDTLLDIYKRAEEEGLQTDLVADKIAEEKIRKAEQKKAHAA